MGTKHPPIELSLAEIRAVSDFALRCAERVLPLFAEAFPDDPRPALAILAGHRFADGGPRETGLRRVAMDAWRAGREATAEDHARAGHAAFSASSAGASAFLHPFAEEHQVKHILGAGGHAVCALELDDLDAQDGIDWVDSLADDVVREVLRRLPPAPPKGGRVGAVVRRLDAQLRGSGGAEPTEQDADTGA
ncbi:hypothetical protein BW730_15070 [Tessaracoccus aquimaris]|uniref:Imm-5-like domain-containing protein n=1 Tax=Tessaracoccus aquimaris TaxID=1332264 RepID=A0A1Q2CR70_9ACTN|nr:hypothetical protein [Tessaracoccus aquimaris]AQP48628.1 hypothetical protein BW730_15070 [Tessaracoccus aquimaris]